MQLDMLTNEKNLKAVLPHIDENINTISETTQAVRDTMNNLEVEVRIANRTTQATYISVYIFFFFSISSSSYQPFSSSPPKLE